jgi:pyruvate formate lyase activating enzyme
MTADEIMEEVLRDIIYYNKSGGGVTASGGEPCMQAEFLSDLFRRCKRKGIHTTLETSGFVPSTALEEILAYTELVLYDVKLMDSAVHERLTGYGNELILENIKIIERMNIPFFLRIPLIPEINDNEKNLKATAQFAKRWRGVQGIDLLPYHRFGMMKYKMLGRSYELEKIQTPSLEQIERAKNIIESFNFACQVGG